jgi:hypothetical protein
VSVLQEEPQQCERRVLHCHVRSCVLCALYEYNFEEGYGMLVAVFVAINSVLIE